MRILLFVTQVFNPSLRNKLPFLLLGLLLIAGLSNQVLRRLSMETLAVVLPTRRKLL